MLQVFISIYFVDPIAIYSLGPIITREGLRSSSLEKV